MTTTSSATSKPSNPTPSRSSSVDRSNKPGSSTSENSEHTVKRGETMESIAEQKKVDLDRLMQANPQVSDPNALKPGQVVTVPPSTPTDVAKDAAARGVGAPTVSETRAPADGRTVAESRARAAAAESQVRAQIEAGADEAGAATGAAASEAAGRPAPAPLSSTRTLRRGATGGDVRDLQEQLNARGANLAVDGDFGPRTQSAVRQFQRNAGIAADGVVGPDTRAAFEATAQPAAAQPATTDPDFVGPPAPADAPPALDPTQMAAPGSTQAAGAGELVTPTIMRSGMEGPAVEDLQTRLNAVAGSGLSVDGDFGPRTRNAVMDFQSRAGIDVDGVAGPQTMGALAEVEAGTRELAAAGSVAAAPQGPVGPRSREIEVDGNTFRAHDMTRSEYGRTSVPGNRIISLDSNSLSGRAEQLNPLIVIPDDATPQERQAAQAAVDRVAEWLDDNTPGQDRPRTGTLRTTSENGRGLRGFYHTEFASVNDDAAMRLMNERPQEFAQILGETMGQIPGANFIAPHGNVGRWGPDPGAVHRNGTYSELQTGRNVIQNGFFALAGNS